MATKKKAVRRCSVCGLPGHTKASHGRAKRPVRSNVDAYTDPQGRVHPIRSSAGYDSGRLGHAGSAAGGTSTWSGGKAKQAPKAAAPAENEEIRAIREHVKGLPVPQRVRLLQGAQRAHDAGKPMRGVTRELNRTESEQMIRILKDLVPARSMTAVDRGTKVLARIKQQQRDLYKGVDKMSAYQARVHKEKVAKRYAALKRRQEKVEGLLRQYGWTPPTTSYFGYGARR